MELAGDQWNHVGWAFRSGELEQLARNARASASDIRA